MPPKKMSKALRKARRTAETAATKSGEVYAVVDTGDDGVNRYNLLPLSSVDDQAKIVLRCQPQDGTKCISCGRIKSVKKLPDGQYHCSGPTGCGAMFDDDPDEGGDYAMGNPARRLERDEERRERARNGNR